MAVAIVVLGMMASLITHLVLMGAISARIEEQKEYARYNTISVGNVSSADLKNTIGKVNNTDVVNAFLIIKDAENSRLIIGWYGNTITNWFPKDEGTFIESSNEAYVSSDIMIFDEAQEQYVEVYGKKYEVVGSTSLWSSNLTAGLTDSTLLSEYSGYSSIVFVTISSVRDMTFGNACLRVQLTSIDKYKDGFDGVISEFLDTFDANILVPQNVAFTIFLSEMRFFLITGTMCFLAYINILAVYWYILDKQTEKYSLFMLMGATRCKMFVLMTTKYIVTYSAAFALAMVLSIPFEALLRILQLDTNFSAVFLLEIYAFGCISYLILSIWKICKLMKLNVENLAVKV